MRRENRSSIAARFDTALAHQSLDAVLAHPDAFGALFVVKICLWANQYRQNSPRGCDKESGHAFY